nr:ribonuclease H-like domain-containing protein [Tanacetum cinerariifolium]
MLRAYGKLSKKIYGGNAESKKMQKNVLKVEVSTEDINQKFLRSLPSAWSNVSLIMRNKEGIDDMDIDDLYNTLKDYEGDVKGTSGSSSSSLNIAAPQLDYEDLKHVDIDDIEEIDLKWQVILNGNGTVEYTKNAAGKEMEVPPTAAKDILARTRERKARSALLMAVPKVYLPRYHEIKDAKGIWEAIEKNIRWEC